MALGWQSPDSIPCSTMPDCITARGFFLAHRIVSWERVRRHRWTADGSVLVLGVHCRTGMNPYFFAHIPQECRETVRRLLAERCKVTEASVTNLSGGESGADGAGEKCRIGLATCIADIMRLWQVVPSV